jgi:uncharacterized protein
VFDQEHITTRCQRWLELAVIGLNLCPFAKSVFVRKQILWRITQAHLLVDLDQAFEQLAIDLHQSAEPMHDTALLVIPEALVDFFDFNVYLAQAQRVLARIGLAAQFQIASFHPRYCFDGAEESDVTNASNQAPYPMLHLLRETSVSKALANYQNAESIVARNQATLRALGQVGWQQLQEKI